MGADTAGMDHAGPAATTPHVPLPIPLHNGVELTRCSPGRIAPLPPRSSSSRGDNLLFLNNDTAVTPCCRALAAPERRRRNLVHQ
jgi:hypothetical protein